MEIQVQFQPGAKRAGFDNERLIGVSATDEQVDVNLHVSFLSSFKMNELGTERVSQNSSHVYSDCHVLSERRAHESRV